MRITLADVTVFVFLPGAIALAIGKYFYPIVGWPALIPAWIVLAEVYVVALIQVVCAVRRMLGRRNQKAPDQKRL